MRSAENRHYNRSLVFIQIRGFFKDSILIRLFASPCSPCLSGELSPGIIHHGGTEDTEEYSQYRKAVAV